ncbi:hypothetical protein MPRS_20340 [Mycobacterium paraseoulense]|nr:hypothetical protein MPRS_20340 [Mycobacterium paraseoulense]
MLFIAKQPATEVLIAPDLRRNFDHIALGRRLADSRERLTGPGAFAIAWSRSPDLPRDS